MNEKITRFSIGQFAALHGINKKTLMWYDEVGIFHPAEIHPENGYRYYNYQQSSLLETILILRDLDLSLKDIGAFVKGRSASKMEQLLGQQLEQVEQNIAYLQSVAQVLASYRQDMRELQNIDLTEISLVECSEKCLVTIPVDAELPMEKAVERMIEEIEKYQIKRRYHASYGSMIPVSGLYKGNFETYSMMFMECPQITDTEHIRPSGTYLQAYCKGDWDKLPARYAEILQYTEEKGIVLEGYAYETGINTMVIDTMEEYITKIEIPVSRSAISPEIRLCKTV